MALHGAPRHLSGKHIQRGKERRGAVALVIVCHGRTTPLFERQPGLSTIKGLDLALFIDAEHHRMRWRADIEPHHIVQLLGEGRIVGQFEVPPAMRAEPVRLPDRAHGRCRQTNFGRHRTKRPMGSLTIGGLLGQADHLSDLVVRRFGSARRTCLLSKQAIHAFFLEPLAPTPDAFFGLARGGHNGHHTEPIRT